jgi:peptidoglycan/LPS O-acetylase OafA/YrhL
VQTKTATGTARAEALLLAAILIVVASAAGWASFTHVHDWTMRHVPPGTPDAFGWVNAVISELVPVAALLTIRQRRRNHQPIGYPLGLLIAAAALSLAAQLAVANPSPSGWLLSAVPALAFMALVKLVFAGAPAHIGPAVLSPSDLSNEPDEPSTPAPADEPTHAVASMPPPISPTIVPVPAEAFTRLNGTPVIGPVTR